MNLTITLITVIIISFLYAKELNRMQLELRNLNKELDFKASHDQLTGLLNRHRMLKYIDNLKHSKILIAMIDIDDFKVINDTYGHDTGDYVLKQVAKLLSQYLKKYHIARWGGEEFLILIQDENWEKAYN